MPYEIRITRQASKDIATLTPKLRSKLRDILVRVIAQSPYEGKKLLGNFLARLGAEAETARA